MNKLLMVVTSVALINEAISSTPLDASQVLQFPIARDGLTRISIENDSIEDIYAYPTEYADNIQHHKSGHVFVVADEVDRPLYVTLITKRGIAQDLKLTPTKKKSEPIVLRFEDDSIKEKENFEHTSSLLEKFVQGIIPAGFYAIKPQEASRGRGGLTAIVETAYQDAHYRILIYTVKSESGDPVPLDNRLLWEEGDAALAFDQPTLEVTQSAKMFIVQKL